MKNILIFCLILFCTQAFAEEESKFLEKNEWPVTCDAAVVWLVEHLDNESKTTVKETPREGLIKFHHGWGTGIRNNFGLWRGNQALMESCMALREGEQFHPDTVSMILIEEAWARLNGVSWK